MTTRNLVAVDGEEILLSNSTCYLLLTNSVGAEVSLNFAMHPSHVSVYLTVEDLERLAAFLGEAVKSIG